MTDTRTSAPEAIAPEPMESGPSAGPISGPAGPTEKAITQGRSAATPFVLLGGVALAIWVVVAMVAAVLLLVWWLG